MLPVTLLRESCSPDAERLIRKLGRVPYVADPWLPVTTIGPLLVMAHHNPKAGDLWGVPPFMTIRVLITPEQYQNTRKDLVQRFGQMPISQSNTMEQHAASGVCRSGPGRHFQLAAGKLPLRAG
jgi:hypothetical protein